MSIQAGAVMAAGKKMSREVRLTILLFSFALFGLGVPRVFTATAAETLFIHSYGAEFMPWAYVAQAFLIPLFGHLYVMADERLTVRKVIVGSMIADGIIQLSLFLAFTFTDFHPVGFAAIIWFETEFAFSSLWLWGLATQLMTLREGKKYFGYIIAGEPIAVIFGGLSTPLILEFFSTQTLFLISGTGVLIGAYICFYITSLYTPQRDIAGHSAHDAEEDFEPEQQNIKPWYKEPYVQILVALVVLAQAAFFFTDSAFYLEAGKAYPEEEELGAFIGKFMAAVGCVSLFMTLCVSGPLLKRFGLRTALLLLPVLVGAIAFLCAFMGLGVGATAAVFWLAFALKTVDLSVRYTIDKTSSVALLQPLPASQRTQVQAALESGIEPLVGGISGLILVALVHFLGIGADGIALIVGVLAVAWIILVVIADRHYQGALRASFIARRFGAGQMALDDAATIATIQEALQSKSPGAVLNALSLVDRIDDFDMVPCYRDLLSHPEAPVRMDVLNRIEALGDGAFPVEEIAAFADRETDPAVRSQALRTLSALDPAHAVDRLQPLLNAPEEELRRQAYVGLLIHGGIEGILCAGEPLLAALRSSDPQQRLFGTSVLEAVAAPGFGRLLTDLLNDSDAKVRTAALRAVGKARTDILWPKAIELLADLDDRVNRTAGNIIPLAGDAAIPNLVRLIDSESTTHATKRRAAEALGNLKTIAARNALIERFNHAELDVSHALLFAVPTGHREVDDKIRKQLIDALHGAVRGAGQAMAWRIALTQAPLPGVDAVLTRALRDQISVEIENVFRLITLLYPASGLDAAWQGLMSGDASKQAFALEAIETSIDRIYRPVALAMLEHEKDADRLKALPVEFKPKTQPKAENVAAEIVCASPGIVLAWTRASALYTLLRTGGKVPAEAVGLLKDQICRDMLESGSSEGSMLTIEKVLALRSTPIFRDVREEHLVDVAQRAEPVELEGGAVLFERGEEGNSMFLVVDGKLKVHVGDKTLAELTAGQVVGEMAAVDPEPRSASVHALEQSLLLRISHSNLELLIDHDPDVARGIIKVLCSRLRDGSPANESAILPAPPGASASVSITAA